MIAQGTMRVGFLLAVLATLALWGSPELTQAREADLDYQRLSARLDHLRQDPVLGQYAEAERARARSALQNLQNAGDDLRAHWLYLAERRVDIAFAAAQLADARHKNVQLEREHNRIMLEATRQEAARVRRELEMARIQNLAAQEAANRLREQGQAYASQAEQARTAAAQAKQLAESQARAAELSKRQAELAEAAARSLRASMQNLKAQSGPKGEYMVLGSTAFASGQSTLQPEVTRHLGKLVQFVQGSPDKPILIEGYTDSVGNADRNRELSRQRAASVRDALVAAGVEASRIQVQGYGESDPVASNDSASGRAQNRRVVVILEN